MRKRTIPPPDPGVDAGATWLPLDAIAEVEVSSEAPGFPVESALGEPETESSPAGWRSASAGTQIIRLHFESPQTVRRVRLVFRELSAARTQEFVLRASTGGPFTDVVRQHYNFAPPAITEEIEDYRVTLDGVTAIEVEITPDISGGPAIAAVEALRIG